MGHARRSIEGDTLRVIDADKVEKGNAAVLVHDLFVVYRLRPALRVWQDMNNSASSNSTPWETKAKLETSPRRLFKFLLLLVSRKGGGGPRLQADRRQRPAKSAGAAMFGLQPLRLLPPTEGRRRHIK